MKHILYFLLLFSCCSFGWSPLNNGDEVATNAATIENIWKIYDSDSPSIAPKSIESVAYNLPNASVSQYEDTTNYIHFNFADFSELALSEYCRVKFKTQNKIRVPFKRTDIIFPFHTHL